jgi:hypothetical protein
MADLIDKDFIVNVGPGATFTGSGSYHTTPQDIDDLFNKFKEKEVRKIALFFHGGLVGEEDGLKRAREISPSLIAAGVSPICFVWETAVLEVISGKIYNISQTKLFNKTLKNLLKSISRRLPSDQITGRAYTGQGFSSVEIEAELSKPYPFETYGNIPVLEGGRSANDLPPNIVLEKQLLIEFTAAVTSDYQFQQAIATTPLSTMDPTTNEIAGRNFLDSGFFISHLVKIAIRVIDRYLERRDHDFYPTVVEEILREFYIADVGAGIWKLMKDKAEDMWKSNKGRNGDDRFVGRYFLERLTSYVNDNQGTTVDLIGHSAGSIAICHLLHYTQLVENPFKYRNIIFLAPACRTELFKKEIVDHQNRFEKIRIFTMSDVTECEDVMLEYVYTHSLLYLISGILEDRGDSYDAYILGMERHIAFKYPYNIADLEPINSYLYGAGQYRVSFSKTIDSTVEGMQTLAIKHGGFAMEGKTLASIQFILRQ